MRGFVVVETSIHEASLWKSGPLDQTKPQPGYTLLPKRIMLQKGEPLSTLTGLETTLAVHYMKNPNPSKVSPLMAQPAASPLTPPLAVCCGGGYHGAVAFVPLNGYTGIVGYVGGVLGVDDHESVMTGGYPEGSVGELIGG